ncbi:Trk K+ transport system NAD-binding subunit [Lentzea atacamensis]|uniref:Trk K+ transport system NAD-binding subunit n=1 Tax=Lentzea atacamensis TaxID=531938 RepID=A0ABX9EB00_9PSEU|nr:NAD(P)-binding protein [Lentzea atacamensis]RAS67330.1 Trk K+ transport system NAD-binding subunit [Lentzea atacamensis]
MGSRTVLIGYSARGRAVVSALRGEGHAAQLSVVDADPERVAQAAVDGVHVVTGHGWRLSVLWSAGVHTADHVVVAVADDAMAIRITAIVRSMNETATVIGVVRDTELHGLVEFLGADHVLGPVEAVEWAFGLSDVPCEGSGLQDLEWTVAERAVMREEIGCSPLSCGHQVLAVVRDGRRVWVDDPSVAELRGGDRLLVLSTD